MMMETPATTKLPVGRSKCSFWWCKFLWYQQLLMK